MGYPPSSSPPLKPFYKDDVNGRESCGKSKCKGVFLYEEKDLFDPVSFGCVRLLVPIVYAASHDDQGPKHPSSASVQLSDEEDRAQDGTQNSQENNRKKQIRIRFLEKERAVKIYRNNNFK